MRMLAIDDEAKRKVKRVLDHALEPAHWYRPHKDARIPSDDPNFVAQLDSFRCVFTITIDRAGAPWRHLSISIPGKNFANPVAAFTIAELFGFSGWNGGASMPPASWAIRIDHDDHCIAFGQEYKIPPQSRNG